MMGLFNPPLRKPINPLTIVGTTNPYFQLASGDDGPAILFETSRFNSSIGCITNTTSPLYGGFHGSKFTLLNEDYTANPIVPFDLTKDTLWTIDFASKPETGSLFPPSVLEAIINKSVFLNDNFAEDTNDWTITPNGSVVVTHSVSTLDNGKQSSGKCCVITATTAASSDNVFVIEQNDVDLSGVTSISLSTSYEIPSGNETVAECDVLFWKDTTSSWVHIDTFEITSTHTQFTSSLIPEDIELFSKIRLVYQFMYFTVSPADPLVIYLSDLITAPNYSRIHTRWISDFITPPRGNMKMPKSVVTVERISPIKNGYFETSLSDWTNSQINVTNYNITTSENGGAFFGNSVQLSGTVTSGSTITIEQQHIDLTNALYIYYCIKRSAIGVSSSIQIKHELLDSEGNSLYYTMNLVNETYDKNTILLSPISSYDVTDITLRLQIIVNYIASDTPVTFDISDIETDPLYPKTDLLWEEVSSHTHTESDITDLQDYTRWRGSSATAPDSPSAGDRYYNSTDSRFYEYNGSSWITAPKFHGSLATEPSSAVGGDTYYNSGDSKPHFYTGSAWVALT